MFRYRNLGGPGRTSPQGPDVDVQDVRIAILPWAQRRGNLIARAGPNQLARFPGAERE